MSKAVMISIKPKWVELIASGRKTVEVRKTRPKIDVPFKCYIYCSKYDGWYGVQSKGNPAKRVNATGKVVGEFVCDKVFDICISVPNGLKPYEFPCTGLTDIEIMEYLGNGRTGYGWHISDLKMYDKPKELSEFRKPCIMPESPYCPCCEVGYEFTSEEETEFYRVDGECNTEWRCLNFIKRPPQSLRYVKERN